MEICQLDQALFFWHYNGSLFGIICVHVDDFLWTGISNFEEKVMKTFMEKFKIGSFAGGNLKYLDLRIIQGENHIILSQCDYINGIQEIDISNKRKVQRTD